MSTSPEFAVPLAKSDPNSVKKPLPCPFTAQGILQPGHLQPPPMFGPRGSTIPPKHLAQYKPQFNKHQRPVATAEQPNNRFQPRNNFNRPRFQHSNRNNNQTAGDSWSAPSAPPNRNREFWCEPCDRDFRDADQLAEHRALHQKCGIDSCPFEGHEMMVSKHIQQQHSTGLYDRIKNLNTPEDIAKWREERRKKYPTKENVQMRQQIQEAKQKRGERLEDSKSRFGRKGDRKQPPQQQSVEVATETVAPVKADKKKKRPRKRKAKNVGPNSQIVETTTGQTIDDSTFGGTGSMKGYKHPIEVNVLSGLLGCYASDDSDEDESEEDDDEPETHQQTETIATPLESKKMITVERLPEIASPTEPMGMIAAARSPEEEHSDAPVEMAVNREAYPDPIIPEVPPPQPGPSKHPKRTAATKASTAKRPKTILDLSKRYRNQNTMLEKLLQKEIRHERNVLLQCVRHVVQNNFFGVEPAKEEK